MQFREIPYDQYTPITAYHALATKGSCLLESSPGKDRFSFIGVDPIASLSGQKNYAAALRQFRNQYAIESDHPLALYAGGAIGYVTFEGDYFFQLYRSGACFDHQSQKAVLFTLDGDLDALFQKLEGPLPVSEFKVGPVTMDLSDEELIAKIGKAKEHLRAGDVYQIVLSRTFQAKVEGDPFQFYRKIRQTSPAPYLFFFDLEGRAIVGASPEKVVSVQNGVIESMPIAGTRPKGAQKELLNCPKEAAEHVMLVDLARNDVGAVSKPGSVQVAEFKALHEFSHVDHLVSRVVGSLDERYDSLDAFQASFPAGTLTGAPKKRAMELIEEIELTRRGLYGGAIVAIDAKGDLTSCIAIRMGVIEGGVLSVRAGAGIVLDSDPQKEAMETRYKARSLLGEALCS